MGSDWEGPWPARRFDWSNAALGVAVSFVAIAVLGYGTLLLVGSVTPPDAGVNIGGGLLAYMFMLVAVAAGSSYTARRAEIRGSEPVAEGMTAGLVGLLLTAELITAVFLIQAGASAGELAVELGTALLYVVLPGVGAAFGGTALGRWLGRKANR